eukprot:TRINITY_DN8263_c0_g1_i1.p1 TRINITY_DN8263_c0_g1~~TRINITY_DN8263_c0_g1_i1.p1  ORF type:complete len:706 (-),score=109.64 TRINITY_DN8263_c0_g1_i1:243-2237(-)
MLKSLSRMENLEATKEFGKFYQQMLYLEIAFAYQYYGRIEDARNALTEAENIEGCKYEIVGELGVRTEHQTESRAQMVVKLNNQVSKLEQLEIDVEETSWLVPRPEELAKSNVAYEGWEDPSQVFYAPKPGDGSGDSQDQIVLSSSQQCLLLGKCTQVKKSSAADELQPWSMAPYVECIQAQKHSRFMLQAYATLLRVRHEKERPRTRERALISAEQLINEITSGDRVPVQYRMRFALSVWFPTLPALRRELGHLYVGYGLMGEALDTFAALELWDDLILCYTLLKKKETAEAIVMNRLAITPDNPKLLCCLADLKQGTEAEELYLNAWNLSGQRYPRAKRALGRRSLSQKHYKQAGDHLHDALSISPLHAEAWFSLGYCRMKQSNDNTDSTSEKEESEKQAIEAFTRCVQQDLDHGEAWNNIAALLLKREMYKEAFSALKEAVRLKRDVWQLWDNYSLAAVHSEQWGEAINGCNKVQQFTHGKKVNIEVMEKLVEQIRQFQSEKRGPVEDSGEQQELGSQGGLEKYHEKISYRFGQLIKQQIQVGDTDSRVWKILSNYYGAIGDKTGQQESLMKYLRTCQGWQKDHDKFAEYAEVSIQLCQSYMQAYKEGAEDALRQLSSGRMHLRNLLKQTEQNFGETNEYLQLQSVLEQLQLTIDILKEKS